MCIVPSFEFFHKASVDLTTKIEHTADSML